MPGQGAAGRIKELEDLFDRQAAFTDYWKVRALRAEGAGIPTRPHPAEVGR